MRPYRRQALATWGIFAGGLACGAALWRVGLRVAPASFLLTLYLAAVAIIVGYRWVRRYSATWPDVAGEQMWKLERRREQATSRERDQ